MAESIAFFDLKSIGLSGVYGRKPCTLLQAARHNLREIQAELGSVGRIDPKRSASNSVLHGPLTAAEVQAQAGALLAAEGINVGKLRKDHAQAIEAVFSLPPNAPVSDRAAYFARCLDWITGAMGLPVLSAVVHRDEAAQHLHALMLPVKNRKHVGGKPIAKEPYKLLKDEFFAKVAGPAGLKRQSAKVQGAVKQWAVAAVLHRCEALGLPAANGPMWPVLVAAIRADPTPAMLALEIDVNSIRPPTQNPYAEPLGIDANPIGIGKEGPKHRSLTCVGIAPQTPPPTTAKAPRPTPESFDGVTRERDDDHDVGHWCEELGDHLRPAPNQPSRRAHSDAWVARELASLPRSALKH